jgi:hypothetical protein
MPEQVFRMRSRFENLEYDYILPSMDFMGVIHQDLESWVGLG